MSANVKQFIYPLFELDKTNLGLPAPYTPDGGVTSTAISTSAIYVLPLDQGLYPLVQLNQCIFLWHLHTMPTAATSVLITPITMPSLMQSNPATGGLAPGIRISGGPDRKFWRFTFDDLSTANIVAPNLYRMRKTAADTALTIDGVSYDVGTRHAIPFCEDLAFIVSHDGDDATGVHTCWVIISRT